jgi:cell wall-associated NlpC family hydrolase
MSNQANAVLAVAKKYVAEGYKEGANNDNIFGVWYGEDHQSWCAMFVSYCFAQANALPLIAGIQSPKGFAYCPTAVQHFTTTHQLVPVSSAQAGDIVFFNWDGQKLAEHVGLVVANDLATKTLTTYEGNTTAPGTIAGNESNGGGCYEKHRLYQFVVAVARPKWTS